MKLFEAFNATYWYSQPFPDARDAQEYEFDVRHGGPIHGFRCLCCGTEMYTVIEQLPSIISSPEYYTLCSFCGKGIWFYSGRFSLTKRG